MEVALAVGVLMLPVALVVTSFAPWSEHRVTARALAAEAARSAVLSLSVSEGTSQVLSSFASYDLEVTSVRVGWCGADPGALPGAAGDCAMVRGGVVTATVSVWTPLFGTTLGACWWFVGDHEPLRAHRSVPQSRMKSERGSVTIWVLGLSVLLLLFGGLAIDYWRALALQRELLAVADSAAIAAASGIDEEHYRSTGDVALDEARASRLAVEAVGWQPVDVISIDVDVDPTLVTVTLESVVELGLLGVFIDDFTPFTVRAVSAALPVLVP